MSELPALWQIALLLIAGAVAGFINVVGGGGSLLTVPVLVLLGLPETVANGTSRIAILVQSATATVAFQRSGRLDYALLRRLTPPALAGALLGALVAARLSDTHFRAIFGWVMLGCALLVVAGPRILSSSDGKPMRLGRASVWPLLFGVGFYGGLVQAGVGYLILAALSLVLRVGLVQANMMKVVLVTLYTPIAIFLFVAHRQVDLSFGVVLSAGQALGGLLGAKLSLERGEPFIRATLAVVVLLSAIVLLVT